MNPKHLLINGIKTIPRARRYIDEKHQMKVVIEELKRQNKGLIKAMTPDKYPVIHPVFRDDILLAQLHGPYQKIRKAKGKLLLNWWSPLLAHLQGD